MDHVVFRLPRHLRILCAVGALVVWGGLIAEAGAGHATPGSVVVLIVFVALVAIGGYRQSGLAVIARGDELVVRNFLTTHRIPRENIRGFDRGRPSMGQGKTVLVDTGMSTVPIDVLTVRWPETSQRSSAYHRRENALAALSDWAGLG